ncbi:hypothetical protein GCM10020001_092970 [Nonomuraea salmonea]
MPAMMCRPGAVTSGLRKSPPGPREEKCVIASPCQVLLAPCPKEAVAPGLAARKLSSVSDSGLSRCADGSQWASVKTSNGKLL